MCNSSLALKLCYCFSVSFILVWFGIGTVIQSDGQLWLSLWHFVYIMLEFVRTFLGNNYHHLKASWTVKHYIKCECLTIVILAYAFDCRRHNSCLWFAGKCCKKPFTLSSVNRICQDDNCNGKYHSV